VNTVGAPGCAAGGQALFDNTFASLFGNNVLVNMDLNIIDDPSVGSGADNGVYVTNAAVWLAGSAPTTTAPEPATLALVAPGLLFVGFALRRRRRTS
jgi:PEP-CTERM motif